MDDEPTYLIDRLPLNLWQVKATKRDFCIDGGDVCAHDGYVVTNSDSIQGVLAALKGQEEEFPPFEIIIKSAVWLGLTHHTIDKQL